MADDATIMHLTLAIRALTEAIDRLCEIYGPPKDKVLLHER